MSIKITIKNDEMEAKSCLIVVFSDHQTPELLRSGETIEAEASSGRVISITESEEDYSFGEDLADDGKAEESATAPV